MEKLILKDGTELEIKEGASANGIELEVANYAALGELAAKLTKENVSEVKFQSGDQVTGEYNGMVLQEPHFRVTQEPGHLSVMIGIRQMTAEEQQQEDVTMAISYLSDEQALTVKGLYPEYDPDGKSYETRDRAVQDNILYRCRKDHVSQPDRAPGLAPSLWVALESGEHAGTLEDPIPVPDTVAVAGMEYEYGKYYSEGDQTYICKRGGVPDPESMYGQKVTLQYAPSQLIGQYFELAE